jgi:hypothetical protein
MVMQVKDKLSSAALAVSYQAKALFRKPQFLSYLDRRPVQLSNQSLIAGFHGEKGADMLFGNKENMYRGYRVDIFKGQNRIIFVNDGGRNFFPHDPAKKALFHTLHLQP